MEEYLETKLERFRYNSGLSPGLRLYDLICIEIIAYLLILLKEILTFPNNSGIREELERNL